MLPHTWVIFQLLCHTSVLVTDPKMCSPREHEGPGHTSSLLLDSELADQRQ